jgi:IstB-like ATP binding protein
MTCGIRWQSGLAGVYIVMNASVRELMRRAKRTIEFLGGNPDSLNVDAEQPLVILTDLIGDVPSAGAMLGRFLHHAEIIPITGKSYRLRNTARRTPGDEPTCKADKEEVK